jgi:hypothetical protein
LNKHRASSPPRISAYADSLTTTHAPSLCCFSCATPFVATGPHALLKMLLRSVDGYDIASSISRDIHDSGQSYRTACNHLVCEVCSAVIACCPCGHPCSRRVARAERSCAQSLGWVPAFLP